MEFGYWNIRGLGAPFRMIFEYKEIKYEDKQYRGHPVVPLRPFYPGGPLIKTETGCPHVLYGITGKP